MKFLVWGAGARCNDIMNVYGEDDVVAIIDSDIKKVGTTYRNKEIISLDTYINQYLDYVVIVTPEFYEDVIADELRKRNIFHFFLYKDSFKNLETYKLQAPDSYLIKRVDKEKKQYIYGLNLLGIAMYEDLIKQGIDCEIVVENSKKDIYEHSFKSRIDIKDCGIKEADYLHFATPLEAEDKINCEISGEEYYDLIDKDIFWNPRIEKFKDVHKGSRCFIIGTGPSLRMDDLDTLKDNNEICISMNGIYKSFGMTSWRPDYYVVGDIDTTYYGGEQIKAMDVKNKFVSDLAWCYSEEDKDMYKWHCRYRWEYGVKPDFSSDFARGTYAGLTITFDGAIPLAMYLGCKEIYLLGIDCNNYGNKTEHFFDKYGFENKAETGSLNIEQNILAYESARDFAEQNGVKIYNATRGGKLEVFERTNFDDLF